MRLGIWGGLGLAVIALPASRRICAVLLLLVLVLHLNSSGTHPMYFAQTLRLSRAFHPLLRAGPVARLAWPYVTLAYVVVRVSRRQ